ncbi:MAG: asparaginase [Frankiales bacterium]|nr:asparaginase [Frankiales bacterium]
MALRADGSTALRLGVVDEPVFPRSANKPLQAVGLLEAGWLPTDSEALALATASHSGQPEHLEVVRRTLAAAGLDERALQCPSMLPLSAPAAAALLAAGGAPTPLTMNCSGKHAAMLACCVARGWDTADYLAPGSPVQQAVLGTIERLAGEPVTTVAVDGCGAPQHALTLTGLARAYARIATGDGPAQLTSAAMRSHPHLVGGSGRSVTALLTGVPGLIAKDGAEGVYAAALADGGAVAVKVHDGADRAAPLVLVAGLRALGVQGAVLDELASVPVLGGSRPVGELRLTGPASPRR